MTNFEDKRRAQEIARNNSAENIAHRLVAVEKQLEEVRRECDFHSMPSQQAQGEAVGYVMPKDLRHSSVHFPAKLYPNKGIASLVKGEEAVYVYLQPPAPAAVPDGWKLVPIEPDMDMFMRGANTYYDLLPHKNGNINQIYKQMVNAAPHPETED